MAAIVPTNVVGRVMWLGIVPSREAALSSEPRATLQLRFDGPEGESHGGATRPSCSRVRALYPRGTAIRNARQVSILCGDELRSIARAMGVERLDPSWLGATMVVEGIPDFTHLPPSSRLQVAGNATLVVDMLNTPCVLPGPVIDAALPGMGRRFKASANGLRGVVAWVEREGAARLGDPIALFVPEQRAWQAAPDVASAEREPRHEREDQAANEAGVDEEAGGGHGGVLRGVVGATLPTAITTLAR